MVFFDFYTKCLISNLQKQIQKLGMKKVNVYNLSEDDKIIGRIYIDLEARSDKKVVLG